MTILLLHLSFKFEHVCSSLLLFINFFSVVIEILCSILRETLLSILLNIFLLDLISWLHVIMNYFFLIEILCLISSHLSSIISFDFLNCIIRVLKTPNKILKLNNKHYENIFFSICFWIEWYICQRTECFVDLNKSSFIKSMMPNLSHIIQISNNYILS
jgi:hypothetical protein